MLPAVAMAQAGFPERPVRLVVPFAPAGTTDILARSLAQQLGERWGQPVIVDNKPGAATTIGTEFVARAKPDGHTILLTPAPFVIAQYAYPKITYDSRRDFVPVSLLMSIPLALVTNPGVVPAGGVAEFVSAIKAKPGAFSYGSPGNASLSHLAVELFRLQSGIDAVHVPYKGAAPVVADLLAGRIGFTFTGPLEMMGHVKSGKLAVLAVAAPARLGYWSDVPTFRERGYPDFEASAWFGVAAPAGTPRNLVDRISADLVASIRSPDVREKLSATGAEVTGTTPDVFARFLDAEHARWSAAVKAANVTIQ